MFCDDPTVLLVSDGDSAPKLRCQDLAHMSANHVLGAAGVRVGYHAAQGLIGRVVLGGAHVRILPCPFGVQGTSGWEARMEVSKGIWPQRLT